MIHEAIQLQSPDCY